MDFDPNSLSPAARLVGRWLTAVFDESDLAAAWPITTMQFRLSTAQSWILLEQDRPDVAAFDRDELAQGLADVEQPAHPLWLDFAGWRIIRWREVLPDYVIVRELRGTVNGQRVMAPNIEAILITAARPDPVLRTDETVEVERFLVQRSESGWLFAGVGGHLPVPGWPPTEIRPT